MIASLNNINNINRLVFVAEIHHSLCETEIKFSATGPIYMKLKFQGGK
jgi:hypothetical protein